MRKIRFAAALCLAPSAFWAPAAHGGDLLGLYVGASLGRADVRTQNEYCCRFPPDVAAVGLGFDEPHSGWQLFAGLRPLSVVGVEVAYLHLGDATAPDPYEPFGTRHARQSAAMAFGVAYLPLPSRVFDVYGKLGVARLHTDTFDTYRVPFDPVLLILNPANEWSTDLAYGAGTQARLGTLALRLDYERVSARGRDPDFLSVGVTWNF